MWRLSSAPSDLPWACGRAGGRLRAYDAISAAESEYEHGGSASGEGPLLNGLEERRAAAVATAARLSSTASLLLDVAAELRSKASELRIAASHTRFRRTPANPEVECVPESSAWFTVRGIVDGRPTAARWSPGKLDCDENLMQRAQVVVAMGEHFAPPWNRAASVLASLDGPPVIVLLTVMRAFSRVTSIDLHDELLHDLDPNGLRHE